MVELNNIIIDPKIETRDKKDVSLVHIYCESGEFKNIKTTVNLPLVNLPYCINVIQMLDKVRSEIVNIVSEQNNNNIKKQKGMFYKIEQLFGNRMSEDDKRKLEKNILVLKQTEDTGKGIQKTIMSLQKVLNNVSAEERQNIIEDINASIKNIMEGG